MSYAEKLKGGNISEPKEKGEEEEEGEEGEEDKKAGDKGEEEEDPNSNMAALLALPPLDLDLTHVLTIVCGFERNSNPVKAVKEFGITSFEDF